ncbi:MAG: hypothetical protein ACI9EF_002038 [Pseudohongiellaceae bacterium]|jgi:hypothetical protein
MSFLDPYERNRKISLIVWLRLGAWLIILSLGALAWWLLS